MHFSQLAHVRLFALGAVLFASSVSTTQCQAQSTGYPNFGFHSYCNTGRTSNLNGIGGSNASNSFDSGLSGLSRASNGTVYSTSRNTKAAQQLARRVGRTWANMPVPRSVNQNGQEIAQVQQSIQEPATSTNGLLPPMSKQEMLRTFLEGGTPQSTGGYAAQGTASSTATSSAYSNYQTAENEATKSYNAAQRVRYYDKDTWHRKNDASQAEYAANNANYAAQRAQSAAYNGDSKSRGYANLARQAANKARYNANQARYNADTMR